jgi:hypothetical protein
LVGGRLSVTVNWEGIADVLIAQDKPVVPRIGAAVDDALVKELKTKTPEFLRAWEIDGMVPAEYYGCGGEVLEPKAGDSYYFVPLDPHGLKALERTELIECLVPSREDYRA